MIVLITDEAGDDRDQVDSIVEIVKKNAIPVYTCLLYTSDAADERSSVDLGGRRIIKKKKKMYTRATRRYKKINIKK